ncbi:hypothetical protein ACHWQZ_G008756 [Mnemiopsis leidyi]
MSLSSSAPLPTLPTGVILTDEPHTYMTERVLTISDLQVVGTILLLFSLVSICVNSFFSVLIFRNWSTFSKSLYFNTNLLCLLLTLGDLVLSVLLGLPTAIHLTWISHFKRMTSFHFFTRKLEHILFKFIFFLRIIIIAVLSLDRCVHLIRPVQYSKIATKRRMKYVVGLIFAVPIFMDLIPTLTVFFLNNSQVICGQFVDPEATIYDRVNNLANLTLPLTCETNLKYTSPGTYIPLFDVIVIMSLAILAGFIIVTSNLSIVLMILKHAMKPINKENPERRKKMTKNLIRSSAMVVFIAVLFFVSSFPYVWIWLAEFLRSHTKGGDSKLDYKIKFYLTLLTFLPVIIHPWLYLLRMKSVRDITPNISKSVTKKLGNLNQYIPLKSGGNRHTKLDVPHTETARASPSPRLGYTTNRA